MIKNSSDLLAKQEGSTRDDKAPAISGSWSAHKNPRIVRVSRLFGGKDRHSKVSTIRGLRDRRVRLSVPTAIQLYDLQERLGLNQPSKVVDWLLKAAQHEIDKLPPLQFPPENFLQSSATHGKAHLSFQDQECPSNNIDGQLLALSSKKSSRNEFEDIPITMQASTYWNSEIPRVNKQATERGEEQLQQGLIHNSMPYAPYSYWELPSIAYASHLGSHPSIEEALIPSSPFIVSSMFLPYMTAAASDHHPQIESLAASQGLVSNSRRNSGHSAYQTMR